MPVSVTRKSISSIPDAASTVSHTSTRWPPIGTASIAVSGSGVHVWTPPQLWSAGWPIASITWLSKVRTRSLSSSLRQTGSPAG